MRDALESDEEKADLGKLEYDKGEAALSPLGKRKKREEERYGFQQFPRLSYPYLAPLMRQTKHLP